MVKKMPASANFDGSLLPLGKMRSILPEAKKITYKPNHSLIIYFDDFFDNNVVENNLETFRSSS